MGSRPRYSVESRDGCVGSLRLLSPVFRARDTSNDFIASEVPYRSREDNPIGVGLAGDRPETEVRPDEFLVRLGAHMFASRYPREGKMDWWADMVDLFKFYQFLIKLGDIAVGSLVVDDVAFSNGETKDFVVDLMYPHHSISTNEQGYLSGYYNVMKMVCAGPVDEITRSTSAEPFEDVIEEVGGPGWTNKVDPKNQLQIDLPSATRLPFDTIKLEQLKTVLESIDYSDLTAEPGFEHGEVLDNRHGSGLLSYINFVPGQMTDEVPLPHTPVPFPIVTKTSGTEHRPCTESDLNFRYRWVPDPGAVNYRGGDINGRYHFMRSAIWVQLENTSGGAMSIKGIIPLKSLSHVMWAYNMEDRRLSDWWSSWFGWNNR